MPAYFDIRSGQYEVVVWKVRERNEPLPNISFRSFEPAGFVEVARHIDGRGIRSRKTAIDAPPHRCSAHVLNTHESRSHESLQAFVSRVQADQVDEILKRRIQVADRADRLNLCLEFGALSG